MKKSVCPVCKERSCGDDSHTRTKFLTERNVGDRLKIILLSIYDMVEIDNLQTPEIKALLNNLIDEHINETDE